MSNFSSLFKNFCIYSCGSLLLKIISLLVVPLILRKLTPADYGIFSLILSFISIATTIIGLGLRQVVSLEYFHCITRQEKNDLIASVLALYSSIATPLIILLYLFGTSIIHLIFFDSVTTNGFLWILIIVFLTFFSDLFFQLLQYHQLAYQVTCIQVGIAFLVSTLTILFVWGFNLNYTGIILAQLIGYCMSCSITFLRCYNYQIITSINFNNIVTKMRFYLPYGFPFIPRILFSWALLASDKWILAYYGNITQAGIYAIADLCAQVIFFLVVQPWESAYLPYIMNQYQQHKDSIVAVEQKNQKYMYASVLLLFCLIIFGFFTCKPLLYFLLPSAYEAAINHILILSLGQTFLLGSNFASTLIQFHKRTYVLLLILCIPAVCNIVLNLLLVPLYGIYGATFSTFIAYALYWIITLYWNRRILWQYNTVDQAAARLPAQNQISHLS